MGNELLQVDRTSVSHLQMDRSILSFRSKFSFDAFWSVQIMGGVLKLKAHGTAELGAVLLLLLLKAGAILNISDDLGRFPIELAALRSASRESCCCP